MKWMLVGCLVLPLVALATETDPRPEMHVMAKEITELQKYLFSESAFKDPANAPQIKKSLASLEEHLGHLSKENFKEDPSLKVNLSLLQQHMKDANRSFSEGSKPFARFMVQSSLQMCIACHTRKQAADFAWPEPEAKDMQPIEKADYYFATRQFTKGAEQYESIVSGFPGNKAGQWNVRRALLALAIYYARVKEDPSGGQKYFASVEKMESIPVYMREESGAWAKEFQEWAKEKKPPSGTKISESGLLAQAKKLIRQDHFSLVSELGQSFHVRRLRAATLFQRVLEAPGDRSPAKGEALLYLGQIYPRISSNLFFRFGEMYLKSCITEYPKSASAKSCYVALELLVNEGFTGSGGTSVPEDEQVELFRLKRLAY